MERFTPKYGSLSTEQYGSILRGDNTRSQYELMKFADLTKNSSLAGQILETLQVNGVRRVLIAETTNTLASIDQREKTFDYVYGADIGLISGLVSRLEQFAQK